MTILAIVTMAIIPRCAGELWGFSWTGVKIGGSSSPARRRAQGASLALPPPRSLSSTRRLEDLLACMASQNTQERHQAQLDAAKAKLAETAASLLARVQAFGQEMGVEYASTAAAQDAAKAAATQTGAAAKPQREAAKGFLLAVEPLVMQHALRAEMVQSLEAAKPSPAKQSVVDAPTVHAGTPPVRKINWQGLDVELDVRLARNLY